MNLKRLLVVIACLTIITLVPTTWAQDSENGDVEEVKVDEAATAEQVLLNENEAAADGDYDTDAVEVTHSNDDQAPEPDAVASMVDTETTDVENENVGAAVEEIVTDESVAKPKPPSSRSGNYYQYDDYMGNLEVNMGDGNYNYGECRL